MPQENKPEHIECAHESCKSVFWRPQDAPEALRTEVLAQRRGWSPVEPPEDPLNPGPMYCAWGHKE